MSGGIPLRRHVLASLRRLPVSDGSAGYAASGGISVPESRCCLVSCRTASRPNKPVQKTLDTLFVKGSAQLLAQAKSLGEEQRVRRH